MPIEALQGQHLFNAQFLTTDLHTGETMRPDKLSTAKKILIGICTLGIGSIVIAAMEHAEKNRVKALSRDVLQLKDTLQHLPMNEDVTVKMGGQEATIRQNGPDELLQVTIDGETMTSKHNAATLFTRLENDIVSHPDFYGKDAALSVLYEHNEGGPMVDMRQGRLRELSILTLQHRLGVEEGVFSTTSTGMLYGMALGAASGTLCSASDVTDLLDAIHNAQTVNDNMALDLLSDMEAACATSGPDMAALERVTLPRPLPEPTVGAPTDRDGQVRQFFADLVFHHDTSRLDRHADDREGGALLRETLLEHAGTIAHILEHPEALDALPPLMREPARTMFEPLQTSLETLRAGPQALDDLAEFLPSEVMGDLREAAGEIQNASTEKLVTEFLSRPETQPLCAQASVEIDRAVSDICSDIQDQVTTAFDEMIASSTTPEETQNVPQEGTSEWLDYMLSHCGTDITSDGYGRFMQIVLSRYFRDMPALDQHSMVASMIRHSSAEASSGELLGALLKGAGPIMQKMLQGFNTSGMDPVFRDALRDMKSNLAPIPENIVQAYLLDMVERSHGLIRSIEVKKTLGAASVGQALLCDIHLASGETEEAVVKILRPDAKARAEREAAIFRSAAQEVNGMPVTFEGQLARIMDELDLKIEASNIRKGDIYNTTPDENGVCAISSMTVSPYVEPTTNTLVVTKAPGTTLDRYMAEIENRIETMLNPLRNDDPEVMLPAVSSDPRRHLTARAGEFKRLSVADVAKRQVELLKTLREVQDQHERLAEFATRWVTEGIYRKGFYHGDLHAGNMMVSDDRLTIIDFGNATTLTPEEQGHVTVLMVAAAAGKPDDFLAAFRKLLTPQGEALLKEKQADVLGVLEKTLKAGKVADSGKRIAVTLTELQKLGFELPAAIFNFSQCQIRLQGAMDQLASLEQKIVRGFWQAIGFGNHRDQFHPLGFLYDRFGNSEYNPLPDTVEDYCRSARIYLGTLNPNPAAPAPQPLTVDEVLDAYEDGGRTFNVNTLQARFPLIFIAGPESERWRMYGESMDELRPIYDEYVALKDTDPRAARDMISVAMARYQIERDIEVQSFQNRAAQVRNVQARTFLDCMAQVITENLRTSAQRLGFWKAREYAYLF